MYTYPVIPVGIFARPHALNLRVSSALDLHVLPPSSCWPAPKLWSMKCLPGRLVHGYIQAKHSRHVLRKGSHHNVDKHINMTVMQSLRIVLDALVFCFQKSWYKRMICENYLNLDHGLLWPQSPKHGKLSLLPLGRSENVCGCSV